MCVIAVAKQRKLNKEEFNNCFRTNSDGVGMAWTSKGYTHFIKGIMSKTKAWKLYQSEVPNDLHVIHFRIATAGGVSKELTHPFIISEKSPTKLRGKTKKSLLFHNGCLWNWEEEALDFYSQKGLIPKGTLSDSRFFATKIFAEGKTVCKKEQANKFAVIEPDGNVFMYGHFTKHNDIKFSNNSYESLIQWNTNYNYGSQIYRTYIDPKRRHESYIDRIEDEVKKDEQKRLEQLELKYDNGLVRDYKFWKI